MNLNQQELQKHLLNSYLGLPQAFTKSAYDLEDLKKRVREILAKYLNIKPTIKPSGRTRLKPVSSSTIKAIGYSPSSKTLKVQFRGKGEPKYIYPYTKPELYKDFQNAESKGKFFHENIRPTSLYKKVATQLT